MDKVPELSAGKSKSPGNGKSSHLAAVRSLGLLHDLQEYVSSLQQQVGDQEKELQQLKADRHMAQRTSRKELMSAADKPACIQQFHAAEIADLPPRLRALFEDNKVLKEEAKRYKARAKEAEQLAAKQEQQLLAANEQVRKLKSQMADKEPPAAAAAGHEQLKQQADAANRALEKLDVDARSQKQALAAAAKERHVLESQIHLLQQQCEDKEKEARASAMAAKQAQRRLEEAGARGLLTRRRLRRQWEREQHAAVLIQPVTTIKGFDPYLHL
eukprot:gene10629-10787_t